MSINTVKICDINSIESLKSDLGYRRILIVKPSSLGDILHAFPAFSLLRKSLPNARIDWVVSSNFAMLLSYIRQDLSKIINFRRNEFRETTHAPKALFDLIGTLRTNRYDLIIDMQGLLRSSMMTFVARGKHKAGFADVKEKMSGIFYNIKVSVPETMTHAIEKNCHLISNILGIENVIPDFILPKVCSSDISSKLAEHEIDKNDKYLAVSPSARWKTKTWPPEFFAKIIDAFSSEFPEKKVLLLGAKSENPSAEKVSSLCKNAKPLNLSGKTSLNELVEIIRGSEALITNDSGPMHIAAFLRVPVFAVFGPTLPDKTGPYWPWHKVYQAEKGCVKCLKRTCQRNDIQCQNNVPAKAVIKDLIAKLHETT